MEQILINQKTLKQRKYLKQIQKASFRKYVKGHHAVVKTRIGKFVTIKDEKIISSNSESIHIPELSSEELLHILEEKQLTGMSGNNFPVSRKIEAFIKNHTSNHILVINGVECEPGLLHDEWLMKRYPNEITGGIRILSKALNLHKIIFATKTDMKYRIPGIEFYQVPTRYPLGEEHLLLHQILGISLKKEEHPAENGFLVMNVQTVYQLYHLCNGTYKDGRYVTLSNIETGEAKICFVKNGESIKKVLEHHFPKYKSKEFFAGGGILSSHLIKENESFDGNISFAAVGKSADISNKNKCRQCGKCSRKCPMGVNVKEIVKRREINPTADITGLGFEKCIHCNSCTYFCKTGKNISAYLI